MWKYGFLLALLSSLVPNFAQPVEAVDSGDITGKIFYTGNNWGYLEPCPT